MPSIFMPEFPNDYYKVLEDWEFDRLEKDLQTHRAEAKHEAAKTIYKTVKPLTNDEKEILYLILAGYSLKELRTMSGKRGINETLCKGLYRYISRLLMAAQILDEAKVEFHQLLNLLEKAGYMKIPVVIAFRLRLVDLDSIETVKTTVIQKAGYDNLDVELTQNIRDDEFDLILRFKISRINLDKINSMITFSNEKLFEIFGIPIKVILYHDLATMLAPISK